MKIFMLVNRLRYGGAYKMFLWLANSLSSRGHDVTVMTFMPNDDVRLNKNVRWIKREKLAKKSIFTKIFVIRKEIKKINPDVSVSFLLDANVYNMFACIRLRTKSIVCERNDPFKPGYRVLKFWKPWFRLANGAVFQLPKVAEYYNVIKVPYAIIPNPVIQSTHVNMPPFIERDNIINILGRLDLFQKRHDILIKAFGKFVDKYPNFKLYFYGDGPDKDKMLKIVNEAGLADKIHFAGVTDSPFVMMSKSKMYVLTSDFEGIPNSLIEAMSIGLPCISTDCRPGGARILIDDGENGFIVPTGNPDIIAEKMKWYMENPERADLMGEKAKKISEKYSEEEIIRLWEQYFKRICDMNL